MKLKRIEKAVEVIKFAINEGISVAEASIKCNHSRTYVKNVKAQIIEQHDEGIVNKNDYDFFMSNFNLYEGSKKTKVSSKTMIVDKAPASATGKKKVEGENVKQDVNGDTMNITWTGESNKFYATEDVEVEPCCVTCGNRNDECICDGECVCDDGDGESEEKFPLDDGEEIYGHQGYPDGHIKTIDQLIERTGVDLSQWAIERSTVNKWDTTSWKQGFPQTWENFQVKATLTRKVKEIEFKASIDAFKEIVKDYKPKTSIKYSNPEINFNNENNLLELALYDLHIGKLAWAGETGENYDVKIAMKRFIHILKTLIKRAKGFSYDRILFPIGNDFFHSDNMFNTTTAGTQMDEDLRWQKTFSLGIKLILSAIDMLKESEVPIDIVLIPGNHDKQRTYYLGSVLEAWYNDDNQVNVDNGASPRKYYEFGEVLIGLSHGNEEKENSLPLLMATEQKEAWGRTTFHEWHLGHFHKKRNVKFSVFDKAQIVNEDLGVTVRYLSSLSGTDSWHYKKSFVGSQKAGEAFLWNDKTGLIGHLNANYIDFDRKI